MFPEGMKLPISEMSAHGSLFGDKGQHIGSPPTPGRSASAPGVVGPSHAAALARTRRGRAAVHVQGDRILFDFSGTSLA